MTLVLLCFLVPALAEAAARQKWASWLDPVIVCYAVGLGVANLPVSVDVGTAKQIAEVVVPLAIPLLLFQTDVQRWLASSRATIVAFFVAVASAIGSICIASLLFAGQHADLPLAAGMLGGTWTGGSPNLVSVGAALDVSEQTLILTNAADIFVGALYLLALLTVAKPVLRLIMPAPQEAEPLEIGDAIKDERPLDVRIGEGALALALAGVIVAACAGVSFLVLDRLSEPWIMLGLTSLALAASFVPGVREMKGSFTVGNYLILVFCVAIGLMTDLSVLLDSGGFFLAFTASALAMTLAFHYTVCALLRVDVDTSIITSVATVMGPALVVPVAKRLNNRAAFVSGITSGLVGFAMGNYVGIALANVIAAWLG